MADKNLMHTVALPENLDGLYGTPKTIDLSKDTVERIDKVALFGETRGDTIKRILKENNKSLAGLQNELRDIIKLEDKLNAAATANQPKGTLPLLGGRDPRDGNLLGLRNTSWLPDDVRPGFRDDESGRHASTGQPGDRRLHAGQEPEQGTALQEPTGGMGVLEDGERGPSSEMGREAEPAAVTTDGGNPPIREGIRFPEKVERTPFMDEVHQWTYRNRFHNVRGIAPVLSRYRTLLRQASRFVIDDSMVRLCCQLSHEQDKLGARAVLARIPFDVIWLEFNPHVKLREFERMDSLREKFDPENVSSRLGYLVYRDQPGGERWCATEFVYIKDPDAGEGKEIIAPQANDLLFDPTLADVSGSTYWGTKRSSKYEGVTSFPTTVTDETGNRAEVKIPPEWLFTGAFERTQTVDLEGSGDLLVQGWAMHSTAGTPNPWWHCMLDSGFGYGMGDATRYIGRNKFAQLLMEDMKERSGSLRWLVILLAMINEAPTKVVPVQPRVGGFSTGTHRASYFSHSTIQIVAPKDKALTHIRKHLDQASKRARHRVRGHWRVAEYGKGAGRCSHTPVLVEENKALCSKCERLIVWVKDHERGDASLGYVHQHYEVKAK